MTEQVKTKDQHLITESSTDLLKALHLLTRDGQLNADARRKLKQVNHLIQLIKPAVLDVRARHGKINIVDVGSGKSYLGFLLAEAFKAQSNEIKIFSIESRSDLIKKSKKLAEELNFQNMNFILGQAEEVLGASAGLPERVHVLTALHACDTATDEAIGLGLKLKADYMALVPCCQAEVAQMLKQMLKQQQSEVAGERVTTVKELWRWPLHGREFGSHLTNVLRTLFLESRGYQISVTELVGWEHSLKNEFIFAKRVQNHNTQAEMRLQRLLEVFPVAPKFLKSSP
jgi:hypothetical protein